MSNYMPILAGSLLPHVGGLAGAYITAKEVPDWYEKLKKPWFKPPNWLFGPAWTTLYTGMGYASYLVWRDGGGFHGDAQLPLAVYSAQLALNWAWTPIFFGCHKLGLAFAEILVLDGAVACCAYLFWKANNTAGYLMIPYMGWLSLATMLSYKIWKDNPAVEEKKE